MKLPRKLKDMVVHGNGESFMGECKTFTRPPLEMEGEDYRGAGMIAPVKLFTGLAGLEVEHVYGGEIPALNATFAEHALDASQLRFTGAYQHGADGAYDHVEITVRGRTFAIDAGGDEIGGDTEVTYKTTCVYYKQVRNGRVEFEIDVLNKVFIVAGVDRMAEERSILGT
ncbi:phage major tail tube protein [Brevundimonas pishanensis]|uniref:phage major tail tube protein n=1 Tax=Brevundimonas pishanensis TaxID=2896315 RepID=UPI001FA75A1C|nr:phage major tail tube protein [Brevundimonas pishanensis]